MAKTKRRKTTGKKGINEKGKGVLAKWFPMIRSRQEVRKEIEENAALNKKFLSWSVRNQEEFLDFCSGAKGLKVLYDGVFKEIFNAETTPWRLEELLSLILKRNVKIKTVLPNDSVRLGAESSLLYTDIIVQLEDGSLSNVEIQKLGYAFPGERSACYSADHLLRQYKRAKEDRKDEFSYEAIKQVYTIVFFEKSRKEFKAFPNDWMHVFKQKSNTGLEMELLQEYYFLPLDIYRKSVDNKSIGDGLEAWMAFLCFDDPERIVELITRFPKFKAMYRDIYELCLNTEKVVEMYSKELLELDRNTVKYMMDEMQAEMEQQKAHHAEEMERRKRQYEEELEQQTKQHEEELEQQTKQHEEELEQQTKQHEEELKQQKIRYEEKLKRQQIQHESEMQQINEELRQLRAAVEAIALRQG